MVPHVRPTPMLRAALIGLDEWNLEEVLWPRGAVIRVVPRLLWVFFRVAMKLALEEILSAAKRSDVMQQERGWKLFMLLLRMLLCRSQRRGPIPKGKLVGR